MADTGEVAVRGFEHPVRLYEVRWREQQNFVLNSLGGIKGLGLAFRECVELGLHLWSATQSILNSNPFNLLPNLHAGGTRRQPQQAEPGLKRTAPADLKAGCHPPRWLGFGFGGIFVVEWVRRVQS